MQYNPIFNKSILYPKCTDFPCKKTRKTVSRSNVDEVQNLPILTTSTNTEREKPKNSSSFHRIFKTSAAIRWFQGRAKSQVITNTLNSVVDNQLIFKNLKNGSEYNKEDQRSKHVYLKPDLLYSPSKVQKIQKLREIFLEFDNDNSKKLDVDEVVNMFIDNNIPVNSKDLIKLFFKNKKSAKKDKHKVVFLTEDDYYLDFHQLVNFATISENEDKFTEFMRMIKKRVNILKTEKNSKNAVMQSENNFQEPEGKNKMTNDIRNINTIKEEQEEKFNINEVIYLPMTFNKILEYFNNKGKIRSNINKIKSTINNLDTIIELSQNEEILRQKRNSNFKQGLSLPLINQNQAPPIEDKNTNSNFFDAIKTDPKEFERTVLVNKKLDSLHKEINILQIFDSFKNIVNLSSINELKSQFNDRKINKSIESKNEIIGSKCLSDISILYSNLPKISTLDPMNKKAKESVEQSSFNWSPIDLPDHRKKLKEKRKSPSKIRGFSIKERKINFSKSDSIFITNATAEKTFITNNIQKSAIEREDESSKRYFKDNKNSSTYINLDQSNNLSSYFQIET